MNEFQFARQRIDTKTLPTALLSKWDRRVLEEGFVPLPKKLLRCMNQIFQGPEAMEQFILIMAITDYLRPNLSRGPSPEYLAFVSGLTVERVKSLLQVLAEKRLLTFQFKEEDELEINTQGLATHIIESTPQQEDQPHSPKLKE
jgi:hypothetical protein